MWTVVNTAAKEKREGILTSIFQAVEGVVKKAVKQGA